MSKTDIEVELSGHDGNIFSIMARVSKALRREGHADLALEMRTRVTQQNSYEDALAVISEYVEIS
jgi:hypothetical protein